MKITREAMDNTLELLIDANSTAGASLLALNTGHELGLPEDTMIPNNTEELITVLKATNQAYAILSELRESL